MQRIALVINQSKGNVKDDVRRCHQHIIQKYHTTYIFISSKILFLINYCFKVCVLFIKDAVFLSYIFALLQETEHSDL